MIVVDTRELRSPIPDLLTELGVEFQVRQLEVGDYIVGEYAIERKTIEDYVQSIIDGRLPTQLFHLSTNYKKSFLVVIGYLSEALIDRNIPRKVVISSFVGSAIKKSPEGEQGDINLVFLESEWDFAYFLYYMDKKLQNPEPRLPRHYKKSLSGDDELLYITSALSGIGLKKARNLLLHFKTLRNLANASLPEILQVPGIGMKLGKKIYTTFRREYKDRPQYLRVGGD